MSAEGPPPPGGTAASAYAERFVTESAEIAAARTAAERLPGPPPVAPSVGAVLSVLAAGVSARHVVSIGSGGGVSGLWLLRGMHPDGVLTALDSDADHLRAARTAFTEAGVRSSRTRFIFGTPREVLPRLSPGAYDLIACSGPPREYSEQLPGLLDLVHPGGTLVCHGLLDGGRIADRTVRDPQTVAWRVLARTLREDESLLSTVLPVGAGLLLATKRPAAAG